MLQPPSLSLIESEARRLVRRLPAQRLQARQAALEALCDERWCEIGGPEPAASLARSLWRIEPPLAHLFVELYAADDPRLADALGSLSAPQGLALLALAEIARGDADAVRMAYDAMRHFEAGVTQAYIAGLRKTVRWIGEGAPELQLRHASPLHQALAAIVAETGRPDCRAVLQTVAFLAGEGAAGDPQAARILSALQPLGLRFVEVGRQRVRYTLHGAERSITTERLAETLAEMQTAAVA